jgi:tRNA pseudouridine38-40 synthase
VCAYDGAAFSGWQSQPDGRAVQDVVEGALRRILGVEGVRVQGASRTDAGVHALGQVFHVDAAWRHGPDKLRAALNANLPPQVRVVRMARARADFHARYGAAGKRYRYGIVQRELLPWEVGRAWSVRPGLDAAAMRAAAAVLVGRHDFRPFAASSGDEEGDTVRTLWRLDVRARGPQVDLIVEGNGFLYRMVRSLAGALVAAGQGRLAPDEIAALLRGGRRTHRVETAPPDGLVLERVWYALPASARAWAAAHPGTA